MASATIAPIMENEVPVDIGRKRYRFLDSVKSAIVVIGTAAVVFIACRNTLTWHAQYFWGASGDFWQSQWVKFYDYLNGDTYKMGIYGTFLVVTLSFWIYNAIFMFIDLLQMPQFILKYKVQDNTKIEMRQYLKAICVDLFNQTVVGIPVILVVYKLMVLRGCDFGKELPTFAWVVWEMFVFIWIEEFGFYYVHRLLHHPRMYKRFHKMHHEWTAPIGLTAIYCHPLEAVLANSIPMMLGPLICGSHIGTAWLWYMMGVLSATNAHCGYHLPFFPSPEAHDFHHLKFTNNFGMLGVLDRLHGTDAQFRKTKAYERHFMSLSLVPLKQLIPDDSKQKGE